MGQGPEISVVVITCNRAATLALALKSLLAQEIEPRLTYEIVVVDDGSTDATRETVERIAEQAAVPVRLLRTDGLGVPAARNVGAKAAHGRWIASMDDDQLAAPRWLMAMVEAARKTGAKCFGGALTLTMVDGTDDSNLGPRARALLGEHLLGPRLRLYPEGHLPATNNAMIDRELLLSVGGYDEQFTKGGSDTEFFRRLRRAGVAIWFVPEATAQHLIPSRRVANDNFRWTARKVALTRMRIFRKEHNRSAIAKLLLERAGTTILRDGPRWVLGKLRGDKAAAFDAVCSFWFSAGVLRAAVAQVAPRAFRSPAFLDSLDFRQHNGERL